MISYNKALEIIENELKFFPFQQEKVRLRDSLGRILAEDIYADVPFPSFDYSAMDGIGIMYDESIKEWKILGEISAGNYKDYAIDNNTAVYITTGAMIPPGCDTVIPVENIYMNEKIAKLRKDVRVKSGQNVRKKGEDILSGKKIISCGTFINVQHIPMMASCGKEFITVFKQLNIGVLATGDELIPVNGKPYDDKIRSSNLYSIIAAVKSMDMEAIDFGIVKDNKLDIEMTIETALFSDIDVLITTGGISAGKYDYLNDVYDNLGAEIKISTVNIKPGKPFMLALFGKGKNKKLIFGLPGNPVSCLVNFIIFFREPLLKYFNKNYCKHFYAKLAGEVKKKDSKRHFFRGCYYVENRENYVKPVGSQSSGDIHSLAHSNCLIEIEEENGVISSMESVRCIMI